MSPYVNVIITWNIIDDMLVAALIDITGNKTSYKPCTQDKHIK